jgi:hypothetical protein
LLWYAVFCVIPFLFMIVPIVLYLGAAAITAHVLAPAIKRDKNGTPWCPSCGYFRAGLMESGLCPECGKTVEGGVPKPTRHAGRWILAAFIAAVLSHAPAYAMWSAANVDGMVVMITAFVLFAQAGLLMWTIAIMADRLPGNFLRVALLAMVLPQLAWELWSATSLIRRPPVEYAELSYALIPFPGMVISLLSFLALCAVACCWKWWQAWWAR